MAIAASAALVVDLDPGGPRYPGERSLADLVADGVRRLDLQSRPGVAVLRNGGVSPSQTGEVIAALLAHHGNVVLRLPPRPRPGAIPVPVVPVRLLLPGDLFPAIGGRAVYQSTPVWSRMPGEGIRLPIPRPSTIGVLLEGRRPPRSDRWIGAWRSVWRAPWTP